MGMGMVIDRLFWDDVCSDLQIQLLICEKHGLTEFVGEIAAPSIGKDVVEIWYWLGSEMFKINVNKHIVKVSYARVLKKYMSS